MDIRDNSIPFVYGLKNLEIQIPFCWPRSPVPFIELIDTYLWLCPHLETLKIASEDTEEEEASFKVSVAMETVEDSSDHSKFVAEESPFLSDL
nr:hypothetical protein Iba_scaffold35291CG0040 [Ipomoea batatas]GMD08305.1 hypothetical protein Iba_scaffold67585CG0020 [Ipomoea batatas]